MHLNPGQLENFTPQRFDYKEQSYLTYRIGEGPAVILMPEVTGVTPLLLGLAEEISKSGFRVVVPEVLTGIGDRPDLWAKLGRAFQVCIRKEFSALAAGRSGTVVDWLRALCRDVYEEVKEKGGARGVGAIGLCLTGGYALSLIVDPDDHVVAPVMSEPSLPFPLSRGHASDLQMTASEIEAAKRRVQEEDLSILGVRFSNDWISPCARFHRLEHEFGDRFEGIQIYSGPDNGHQIRPGAHAVLTIDFSSSPGHPTNAALQKIIHFLTKRLK